MTDDEIISRVNVLFREYAMSEVARYIMHYKEEIDEGELYERIEAVIRKCLKTIERSHLKNLIEREYLQRYKSIFIENEKLRQSIVTSISDKAERLYTNPKIRTQTELFVYSGELKYQVYLAASIRSYSFKEYATECEKGTLIDENGYALLCKNHKIVLNAKMLPEHRCLRLYDDKAIKNSVFLSEFAGQDFEVLWIRQYA